MIYFQNLLCRHSVGLARRGQGESRQYDDLLGQAVWGENLTQDLFIESLGG